MNKIFIPVFIVLLVVLVGCRRNFDEINTNPNNPEQVNPELLMVNVVRSTVNQMADDAFSVGNIVAQYAAEIREPGTDRYAWGSFSVWSNGYSTLRNVQNLHDIATERKLNNYKGIALVMRALIFSRMTDCYGALPYNEALKGKTENPIYTPKFDTQEEVYRGVIDELKQANQLLSATGGPVRNDILYNGDFLKWKKLANSLRLRLLLRRSAKVDPSAEMKEILNNAKDFPIMETNGDNAVLKYVESPNLFPTTGQRPGFFLDRRLSKTLADKLNELGDPRLPVFAQPTAESAATGQLRWLGVRNGEPDANLGSSIDKKVSALGSIYYNGLQVPVPAQGIILTLAEVKFILAEASHKGWISGNAKSLYEEGIKVSMDYYKTVSGANVSVSNEYLAQPGVVFTPANALQMIGTQRWIALFFTDLQGWHEWKRTGFPVLTPSLVNNNNNRIPVRFLYPSDLQVTNRENYLAAVAAQGEDNINTRLWLNK